MTIVISPSGSRCNAEGVLLAKLIASGWKKAGRTTSKAKPEKSDENEESETAS